MIEFAGHLTGSAKKNFFKKMQKMGVKIMLISVLLMIPALFYVSKEVLHDMSFLYVMAGVCLLLLAIPYIPKGEKESQAILPRKIYIEDDCIICVADRYTESKFIEDVTKVIDHGDYYELRFPFGKISEKFICQKDLLTKGSLEEFESIFDGKVIRK